MRATNWDDWTTDSIADKRAGGRRHYNAVRKFRAEYRRMLLAKLLSNFDRGYQTKIASRLGVSRSTVCRDMAKINHEWRQARQERAQVAAEMLLRFNAAARKSRRAVSGA